MSGRTIKDFKRPFHSSPRTGEDWFPVFSLRIHPCHRLRHVFPPLHKAIFNGNRTDTRSRIQHFTIAEKTAVGVCRTHFSDEISHIRFESPLLPFLRFSIAHRSMVLSACEFHRTASLTPADVPDFKQALGACRQRTSVQNWARRVLPTQLRRLQSIPIDFCKIAFCTALCARRNTYRRIR